MNYYEYVPNEFLPRLKPKLWGRLPAGKWVTRWFGRITRDNIPIVVLSKRPISGVSEHLVADRLGRWIAYGHHMATGRRRLIGKSELTWYLLKHFGVADVT